MSDHVCPWTNSELMAAWAIVHIWGNKTLAEKLLSHASQHPTAGEIAAAETTTNEETQ